MQHLSFAFGESFCINNSVSTFSFKRVFILDIGFFSNTISPSTKTISLPFFNSLCIAAYLYEVKLAQSFLPSTSLFWGALYSMKECNFSSASI